MKIKYTIILLFLVLPSSKIFASHIVGGEIFYNYLGSNNYKITLKLYRDCYNGQAPYDNPATICIFNSLGNFIDSVEIPFPGSAVLPASVSNPCFTPPTDVCVEEAVYTTTIMLPPITGGYDLVYQRCCRNNSILNIIDPGNVGSTYMAHIPDATSGLTNSSPHYINFPPIFLCSGVPLNFDHSAVDPDGDSLYYELCDPFTGLDASCPVLGVLASGTGCPLIGSPPPYSFVPWSSPYNAAYPLSSSPALTINPHTGLMTGTPNMLGQWVVGVCVSEYRNGVLLDVNKRDFQFNVVNCPNLPVASIPQQTEFCNGYTVNFTQNSVNAFTYHWDFGDPTTSLDTSNLLSPTWTYPDSGAYTIRLTINPGTICSDTQIATFYIYPLLNPAFIPPPGECLESNHFNFTGGGTYMGDGTLFHWDFGIHASPSVSNQKNPNNIVYNAAGVFPIIYNITENGCTKSVTDSVQVYPKPLALFSLFPGLQCTLKPVQFTDSSFSSIPLTYNWQLGNGSTSTQKNPSTTYSSPGTYSVTLMVTDEKGCKDTLTLPNALIVQASPTAGFTLNSTDVSIFEPTISMTDQSISATSCQVLWGDGASSNVCDSSHQYAVPGAYKITQIVSNSIGCYDTAYSKINIHPEFLFWIPDAFSPNKDELNDVFKPKLIGVHDYLFLIFDRWGQKIFETSNSEEGWDGYYKNKLCSNDVYVYKITFRDDVRNSFHQYIGKVVLLN